MEKKQKLPFSTIDEYIALQPLKLRKGLKLLRQTIKKAAPEAEELISYQMPAFRFHGMLLYFAAYEKHFGLYAMPKTIGLLKAKLTPYKTSKGTIRFPTDKPIPVKLVSEIVKIRVKENLEKKMMKELKNTVKTKK